MVRPVLIASALALLIVAGSPGVSAAQTPAPGSSVTGDQAPQKRTHKMPHSRQMQPHKQMAKAHGRTHHAMDNISDKLNACQQLPSGERPSCMDNAMHPNMKK